MSSGGGVGAGKISLRLQYYVLLAGVGAVLLVACLKYMPAAAAVAAAGYGSWGSGLAVATRAAEAGAQAGGNRSPVVIFNFGDSNSDTGGMAVASGLNIALPEGRTYIRRPTIWVLGLQKDRLRSPARLLKLSTELWLMRLLIRFGCVSCCRSCTVLLNKLSLFTVIIFQLSTYQGIQFNTVAPSILRSTFILFERRWLSVKFAFSTFLLLLSSLISLLKAWRLLRFKTFVSVSTSSRLLEICPRGN